MIIKTITATTAILAWVVVPVTIAILSNSAHAKPQTVNMFYVQDEAKQLKEFKYAYCWNTKLDGGQIEYCTNADLDNAKFCAESVESEIVESELRPTEIKSQFKECLEN